MTAGWLVIACKGGWEDKARKELERQKYECWLPWALIPRVKRGKPYASREPMFPCYLFIAKPEGLQVEDMNVGAINNTRGVMGVVSVTNGGQPNVIEDCSLDVVRGFLGPDGLYRPDDVSNLPDFKHGDLVKLTQGSFAGFPAHFVRFKRRKKADVAVVDVELFGRVVAVIVPPNELKAAS